MKAQNQAPKPLLFRIKPFIKWGGLGAVIALSSIFAVKATGVMDDMKRDLQEYLTSEDRFSNHKKFDAVYVLGGGQESLKAKYRQIAKLYKKGMIAEIYILSRPGKTEYSRKLGRNLTNDEWAMMTLENLGIPDHKVQPIQIEPGFFGTLSEAKRVSEIVKKNKFKTFLLITSPHHTKRVRTTFNHFLMDSKAEIDIFASKHCAGFIELISEWIKLNVYTLFLLR